MRRFLRIRWYAARCAFAVSFVIPRELREPTWKLWLGCWEIEARLYDEIRDQVIAEQVMGIERREKAGMN